MFGKISKFLLEVKAELKKVAWPTRDQLLGASLVVLVSTFVLALYIGAVDFILSHMLRVLIR